MRTLDSFVEAHLEDGYYRIFELCEIRASAQTYRFTNAPIDITWGGYTWTRIGFSVSEVVIDSDGEIAASVTFDDASKAIRNIALVDDFQERVILVYEAWATITTTTIGGVDITIQGLTDGVKVTGEDTAMPTAEIGIRGIHSSSAQGVGPRGVYDRNCWYEQFKGPLCGYTGIATSCNRLYTTCESYANQHRFGGFRFALGAGERVKFGEMTASTTALRTTSPLMPPPPPSGSVPEVPSGRRSLKR